MYVLPFKYEEHLESFQYPSINNIDSFFKILVPNGTFPSFVCKISDGPALLDFEKNFNIEIYDSFGYMVTSLSSQKIKHKIFKKNGGYYFVYNTDDLIKCFLFDCGYYYAKIKNYKSEWFFITDDFQEFSKITISSENDTNDIPYKTCGFKQVLYINNKILPPDILTTKISKIDSLGNEKVSAIVFRKQYKTKFWNVPGHINELLYLSESCTNISVECNGNLINVEENQFKVDGQRDSENIGTFNTTISFTENIIDKINSCTEKGFELVSSNDYASNDSDCIVINPIEEIEIECIDDENEYFVTSLIEY